MNFPDFQPMSPDEMQRAMQFIVSQQEQFAADFDRVDAVLDRLSAKTDIIADGLIGLTGVVDRVADGLISLTGLVDRVAENHAAAQQETDAHFRETDARLRESDARLTAHIDRVESHLNAVIDLIERRHDDGRPPV